MSASKEWTEWHLTPTGWVQGTTKTDSSIRVEAPPAAVLASYRYIEEASYTISRVFGRIEVLSIAAEKKEDIRIATALFGPCPKSL